MKLKHFVFFLCLFIYNGCFNSCCLPNVVMCPQSMHRVNESFCETSGITCDNSLKDCAGTTIYCAQICETNEIARESADRCQPSRCRDTTVEGREFYCEQNAIEDSGFEDM